VRVACHEILEAIKPDLFLSIYYFLFLFISFAYSLLRVLSAGHAQDAERCQSLLKFFELARAFQQNP